MKNNDMNDNRFENDFMCRDFNRALLTLMKIKAPNLSFRPFKRTDIEGSTTAARTAGKHAVNIARLSNILTALNEHLKRLAFFEALFKQ